MKEEKPEDIKKKEVSESRFEEVLRKIKAKKLEMIRLKNGHAS